MAFRLGKLLKQLKAEKAEAPSDGRGVDSALPSASSQHNATSASAPELQDAAAVVAKPRSCSAVDIMLHAAAPLASCRIGPVPTVHCLNDVISADGEESLTSFLYAEPIASHWVQLKGRRLILYGGAVTARGLENPEPLPPPLARLSAELVRLGVFDASHAPNHALINEYAPGQGILPHTDGPAYFPRVATLSLGSDAIMLFLERRVSGSSVDAASAVLTRDASTAPLPAATAGPRAGGGDVPVQEVLLRRRSLVVFEDDAYVRLLHSIPASYGERIGDLAPCVNADPDPASYGERIGDLAPRVNADPGICSDGATGSGLTLPASLPQRVELAEHAIGTGSAGPGVCVPADEGARCISGGAGAAATDAASCSAGAATCSTASGRLCVGAVIERGTRISITLRHVPLAAPHVHSSAA